MCAQGLGVTSVSLLAMESASDLNLKFVFGLLKVRSDLKTPSTSILIIL